MLHRLFQTKPSPKNVAEGYIRRILYMYKTEMEDTFSTIRYSPDELCLALQGYGLGQKDYYLQMFDTNCAVFLYNKKKNRYERVQRRFLENDIVCALRPTASITLRAFVSEENHLVEHGKYGDKTPCLHKIHNQEVIGDHWMPEYVYHYSLQH